MRLDRFLERTEPPTPRRRQRARRQGQVPVSRDVLAAVSLLGLAAFGLMAGPAWLGELAQLFAALLARTRGGPAGALAALGVDVLVLLLPLFLIGVGLVLLAGFAQTGFLFRPQALLPDPARLLRQGFGRLFSRQLLLEFGKGFLVLAVLGYLTYDTLVGLLPQLLTTSSLAGGSLLVEAALAGLGVRLGAVYLVVAVFEYGVQRLGVERALRMTRAELREEMRQTEGAPEVRRRIRQRQRRLARMRMMAQVKTAQAVVTNPVHLAVALRYLPRRMPAPVVVAKGRGFLAERIKAEAERHGVDVVADPPLAQALYRSVEVGEAIPAELYRAVAELLAVIFRRRGWPGEAAP